MESFDLSPDGKTVAFVSNEDGVSVLHLLDAKSSRDVRTPKLPLGVITGLEWHENNRDLGFTLSSARSPADVYSLDVRKGTVTRWTDSETGALNAETFERPPRERVPSRPERAHTRAHDAAARHPCEQPAPGPAQPPLPDDPARRERVLLLRAYESTTLSRANFCALKRIDPAQLDALLERARNEARSGTSAR